MTKSSCIGLDGIKKFGTCRGSFICLNDDYPIYTAKHIQNRVDFTKEKFGAYSCSNCKVFVQSRQCNARKVTEFDQKDNVLTIYHQGNTLVHRSLMLRNQDKLLLRNARNYHH